MTYEIVLQIATFTVLCGSLICRKTLFSYASEKGRNIATKEDITAITDKVEAVRHEYASQLEQSKAHLNAQIKNHGFRYEKEFEILQELTKLLIETRDTCLSLRPALDSFDHNRSEEERKKERLGCFYQAMGELYLIHETKRPFYPENIYEAVLTVYGAAHRESVRYRYRDPSHDDVQYDYWEDAEKRQDEVVNGVNKAIEVVRLRVQQWESVETSL